ncbi:hypothetical protein M9Y10_016122 [Tritrichomonas musculus]|uniref:Uncharacterized protein n=1 Tax=Tritrichomonas musculus TaxID=1915356 RepID=A0ABR2I5E1_9EUKA
MSLRKHYRKVPPQLSDEELLSLTAQILKRCGVENQTQAQFIYEICMEIMKLSNLNSSFLLKNQISTQKNIKVLQSKQSRNQKSVLSSSISSSKDKPIPFYSLQPRPKIRKYSIQWNQAYSIAISFLKEFGMHTTLATLEIEFKNSKEKNIINTKSPKRLKDVDNDDDEDDEIDYKNYLPGEEDTSFMENLTSSEYISYLRRINDSIYNITGNYSYLTNRGKLYQSKSNSNNSNSGLRNVIPATFREKVEEFTKMQNFALSKKHNDSNALYSNSTSEIILDNGSFAKDNFYQIDDRNKIRYADSANRLKEMTNNYINKEDQKIKNQNEIEIDIEIEHEKKNLTYNKMSFSNSSRITKKQNKSTYSQFKKNE